MERNYNEIVLQPVYTCTKPFRVLVHIGEAEPGKVNICFGNIFLLLISSGLDT